MNIFNTNERQKIREENHQTTGFLTSKNTGDTVILTVKDNGGGILQNIVDQIFQPFITTKPTGQGKGLGLSLSNDIINAHGGEITMEAKENEGTKFLIYIPAS